MAIVRGVIKWFDNRKGFGFILQSNGPDVFVHYSCIQGSGYKTLEEGDVVEYELHATAKGPKAAQVAKIAAAAPAPETAPSLAPLEGDHPQGRFAPLAGTARPGLLVSSPAAADTNGASITPAPQSAPTPAPAIKNA